jgi:hypothetical protein
MFFAETQNKLLYAITGKTAAEIIVSRADASQPNMALTAWKGKIVRKQDIYIAKNYLTETEIDKLNRFIVVFLETAELRAQDRKDITISFWHENVDKILQLNDKAILQGKGSVSNYQMEEYVDKVYEQFDHERKLFELRQADEEDLAELKMLEQDIKNKKKRNK